MTARRERPGGNKDSGRGLYRFWKRCTDIEPGPELELLTALTQRCTEDRGYHRAVRRIGRTALRERFPQYNWVTSKKGPTLRMMDDLHIQYFYIHYNRCAYWVVVHSAVEYIFISEPTWQTHLENLRGAGQPGLRRRGQKGGAR